MELELSLRQKQILSQRMQLSVHILQMNTLDLDQYIRDCALENPLIELEYPSEDEDPKAARLKKLEWLDSMEDSAHYRFSGGQDSERYDPPLYEKNAAQSLYDELLMQLPGFHLPAETEGRLRYIIGNLDENGFIAAPREQLLAHLGIDGETLNDVLRVLHRMDPPGVGAWDLRDCLLLQARRLEDASPVLERLIREHLDVLAKNQLSKLAKALGVSMDEVKKARAQLLTLNPKPGNGYSSYKSIPYIRPDLFIVRFEAGYEVILNDYNLPKIAFNSYYRDLAGETGGETAAYVREQQARAEWLLTCVRQRGGTIVKCAGSILERQRRFFDQGPGNLAPMTLADVAEDVDVHPSTVSRAIRGKYLQCQWGVFGLQSFFSHGLGDAGGEEQSQDRVQAQIRRLIEEEDDAKPFSDQEISERLQACGIKIARRTVAKYREQMGVPPASGRKRY